MRSINRNAKRKQHHQRGKTQRGKTHRSKTHRSKTHRSKHSRRKQQGGKTKQEMYAELIELYSNCANPKNILDAAEIKAVLSILKLHDKTRGCQMFQELLTKRESFELRPLQEVVCSDFDDAKINTIESSIMQQVLLRNDLFIKQFNTQADIINNWCKFVVRMHRIVSKFPSALAPPSRRQATPMQPMFPPPPSRRQATPMQPLSQQVARMSLDNEDPVFLKYDKMMSSFPLCLRKYIKSRNLPFEEEVKLANTIAKELFNLRKNNGQTTQQTLGIVTGTPHELAENCPNLQEFLKHLERTSTASASVPVEANADMIARLQAALDDDEPTDLERQLANLRDD